MNGVDYESVHIAIDIAIQISVDISVDIAIDDDTRLGYGEMLADVQQGPWIGFLSGMAMELRSNVHHAHRPMQPPQNHGDELKDQGSNQQSVVPQPGMGAEGQRSAQPASLRTAQDQRQGSTPGHLAALDKHHQQHNRCRAD